MFLSRFVFDNPSDIKIRKLIVNTFIREVVLYPDRVVITYNFTDSPDHIKFTKEHVVKTEKEIETADNTAFSSLKGSCIYDLGTPKIRTITVVRIFLYFIISRAEFSSAANSIFKAEV